MSFKINQNCVACDATSVNNSDKLLTLYNASRTSWTSTQSIKICFCDQVKDKEKQHFTVGTVPTCNRNSVEILIGTTRNISACSSLLNKRQCVNIPWPVPHLVKTTCSFWTEKQIDLPTKEYVTFDVKIYCIIKSLRRVWRY